MIVFCVLAVTIFPIYAFVMTMFTGPFGLVSAFITLLVTSRRITTFILHFLFMRHIQGAIFDRTLRKEEAAEVLTRYELMSSRFMPKKTPRSRLYYQVLPFIYREILYNVLAIIPLFGPAIVLLFKAPVKSYKTHKRYYKLMMWNYLEINRFCRKYRYDYTLFGILALLLEMIPGLTVCFVFTNNIGMALWTAQYHKEFERFMHHEHEKRPEKEEELEFWNSVL